MIPQYFNHKNFSSFVRQLNFYGFKKKRDDRIKISSDAEYSKSKCDRFHHENFKQGKPKLLEKIKKANQACAAADHKEIEKLRSEVNEYRKTQTFLIGRIEELSSCVESLMQPKRRKLNTDPNAAESMSSLPEPESEPTLPLHEQFHPDIITSDIIPTVSVDGTPMPEAEIALPDTVTSSQTPPAHNSLASIDYAENFDKLFGDDLDAFENYPLFEPPSRSLDPTLDMKLKNCLAHLPNQMQEMFVERLVACIADCNDQVQAVSTLANEAATETHRRMQLANNTTKTATTNINDNGNHPVSPESASSAAEKPGDPPSIAMPLAAAALGAFLAQYGTAAKEDSLALLPEQTQKMLVDRLVTSIADFNDQLQAVSALANEAVTASHKHMQLANKTTATINDNGNHPVSPESASSAVEKPRDPPSIALPLAAATLGACLAQYDTATKEQNCLIPEHPYVVSLEG